MKSKSPANNSDGESAPQMTFWQRVKNVFFPINIQAPPNDNHKTTEEDTTPEHEKQFKVIGSNLQVNITDDISLTKKYFLDYISNVGIEFRKLGIIDGHLEQKTSSIYDIAKIGVANIQAYINAVFKGERDSINSEVKIKKEILTTVASEYESQIQYTKSIKENYRWNYKNFSLVMGGIYLIVAAFLVAADIILSYLVTKEAFAMDSTFYSVLLSIGIALCTIYIKIYYDEYFAFPMNKSVSQFKAENLNGIDKDRKELSKVKRVWYIRLFIKTLILILSITTILALGIVRHNFFNASRVANSTSISQQSFSFTTTIASNDKADRSEITALYDAYNSPSTLYSFLLISLLFPMIGGICASLGADKIQNYKELAQTDKDCKTKQSQYLNALKELNAVEKKLKDYESYLQWSGENSSFAQNYTSYLIACYVHGYEGGIVRANLNKDHYIKAEEMRKKLLAKQVFSKTQSISSDDLYESFQTLINNPNNANP